jgi:hypothetical protein
MEDDRGSPPPDAGEAAGGSAAAPGGLMIQIYVVQGSVTLCYHGNR